MTGLPCEACQEPMIVFQSGALVDDANGRVLYRRFRVCANTACKFYLIRRTTLEVVTPLAPQVRVVSPDLDNLKRLGLPRRTAPLPELPSHPNEL